MTLYERLQYAAKAKKISLPELASRVGIGSKSLYNWKTSMPSSDTLAKVARELRVSEEWLRDGTQKSIDDLFQADGDINFKFPKSEHDIMIEDIELIDSFHNAPKEVQEAIRILLKPYTEDTASAVG